MTQGLKRIIFALFFLSGFCGLLYQIVWLRMAYASFGTITPVLSMIISVFMLGLALGSFFGGRLIDKLADRFQTSPVIFYAVIEFLIGVGAFAVPELFSRGEHLLLTAGEMNSFKYLFLSDVVITISILPWCILMGCTYPFMMSFIKNLDQENSSGFSFLYLANVMGAMSGAFLTAWVLIELAGFYNSLLIAASLNFLVFSASVVIGKRHPYKYNPVKDLEPVNENISPERTVTENPAITDVLLFATGFISMAMEVVWIRTFTPVLLTTVYSFAAILTVYLFSTWLGSFAYRRHLRRHSVLPTPDLLLYLAIFSLLPVMMNDPRLIISVPVILTSIFPFSAALGYLTPKLIDGYSSGGPSEAGRAYAFNISGCVIGPLFASYILLPAAGVKYSLIILGLPFLIFPAIYYKNTLFKEKRLIILSALVAVVALTVTFINIGYEDIYVFPEDGTTEARDFYVLPEDSVVRRDHTATVVSMGEDLQKKLLVNGIGITSLKPVTKMMAHLPLAFLKEKPSSALIICLGMGTTYRSALSWNIKATAVELVPSVPKAMGYYFSDVAAIMKNSKGKIIVDDGRRFLNRTEETFDIITIDPPPPLESSGSSLLYSEEFYELAKKHLKKEGILQQWFPCGELKIAQAAARALSNSFPYVRIYKSVEGWGLHFLASTSPIDVPSVQAMLLRIPEGARKDITEWYQVDNANNLEGFIRFILKNEIPFADLLNDDRHITITDNRPYNEYFFLRREKDIFKRTYVAISCDPSSD